MLTSHVNAFHAQALVRWGGALLELAHYKQGKESTEMIHQVGSLFPSENQKSPSNVVNIKYMFGCSPCN